MQVAVADLMCLQALRAEHLQACGKSMACMLLWNNIPYLCIYLRKSEGLVNT